MNPLPAIALGSAVLCAGCGASRATTVTTDGGTPHDASRAIDAAKVVDATKAVDAARLLDSATAVDGLSSNDVEVPVDATPFGDASSPVDAPVPIDAPGLSDAPGPADAAKPIDAAGPVDAGPLPVSMWTLYTLSPGANYAVVVDGPSGRPLAGLAGAFAGRDYQFVLDPSAMYTITAPVQPNDQFDWNKLPGLSDCDQFDLSVEGVMFGWRWRLDTTPNVLEVTAYANDASMHLTPSTVLFSLDAADLASETPIHYRFWIDGANYQFSVDGNVLGRAISATATLPRTCATTAPSALTWQWAAGFYFGGTSTAPSTITGRIFEIPFQ